MSTESVFDQHALKVAIYGGSNSFMGAGYVAALRGALAHHTGRAVEIANASRGNTFSHYGLFRAATDAPHRGADVVVLEYAINDLELQGSSARWHDVYEGLTRRIHMEAPDALIVHLVLSPGKINRTLNAHAMRAYIAHVAARYSGLVVDHADSPLFLTTPDGLAGDFFHQDRSHYNRTAQAVIGNDLAARLGDALAVRRRRGLPPPMSASELSGAVALKPDQTDAPFVLENSRSSAAGARLSEGQSIEFALGGARPIALIYAATAADGVLEIRCEDRAARITTRRRAFDAAKTFAFLDSSLVLTSLGLCGAGDRPSTLRLTLLTRESEAAANVATPRGSLRSPDGDTPRTAHIIGVLAEPAGADDGTEGTAA